MNFAIPDMRWAAAVFGALSFLLFAGASVDAEEPRRPTITVVGEGMAAERPDMAVVSVGVVTQAVRAEDALEQNSKAMAGVIAAAKEAGTEERDVQTTQVGLQPQYSRPAAGAGEARRLVGYQANNALSIRVRDLEKLGMLLDRLVVAGSNQIRDVTLTVADPEPARDEARSAAMKDAVRKANLFAEAAGVRIVRLMSVVEDRTEMPRPTMLRMAVEDAAAARPPVPIEAGEQEFRARVTAVFEIEGK